MNTEERDTLLIEEEKLVMPCIPLRGISVFPQTVSPVSYTHLDVYKRQAEPGLFLTESTI